MGQALALPVAVIVDEHEPASEGRKVLLDQGPAVDFLRVAVKEEYDRTLLWLRPP